MIKQQLRTGDVLDEQILALFRDIPRDDFVPNRFKSFAYADMQIELPHQQRMMTPLEEGLLLQSLQLQPHETVLEIGTGTGFLTALLSRLCQQVISVDYYADFTNTARSHLQNHNCHNVELITGNGYEGWLDKAPYDVIVFTGAKESLTETVRLQLLPGGRVFTLLGQSPVIVGQRHQLNTKGEWQSDVIFETNLPPLLSSVKSRHFVF